MSFPGESTKPAISLPPLVEYPMLVPKPLAELECPAPLPVATNSPANCWPL